MGQPGLTPPLPQGEAEAREGEQGTDARAPLPLHTLTAARPLLIHFHGMAALLPAPSRPGGVCACSQGPPVSPALAGAPQLCPALPPI